MISRSTNRVRLMSAWGRCGHSCAQPKRKHITARQQTAALQDFDPVVSKSIAPLA
jgi:hypothetical protein